MQLTARTPAKSLDRVYSLQPASRDQIERFKTSYLKLLPLINEKESEENVKDHLMDFLKEVYYRDAHVVAPKGKTDFVIHLGKDATTQAGVLFEVKRPANKVEMITRQNLNVKAFHELLLYYFQERQRSQNSDIRHCVITNVFEWFIFDAALIDRLFFRNAHLTREYKAWATGQKVSKNNDLFYNEIVKPFLAELTDEIPFTYFDIRDYQRIVADADKVNDKALLSLYKILSPTHLLKLPTATDSNRLNPKFYTELLHLIGLEEVKEEGKKVIRRKEVGKRDEGSLLENTIIQLDITNKLFHLPDRGQYGATTEEQLFSVALELCITWINRILFLKLLESQLVKYHNGNSAYSFLNQATVGDFDELFKLFFRVLAKKPTERQGSIQAKFGRVPYLNSSLFEITELEDATININSLEDSQTLPLLAKSVLKDNTAYRHQKELLTLPYLFAFLDAYDFASESREEIQEKNRTLINASVLGLIFEKINGYKDGSYYTPGFITEYMCRETIRKAVVQKFNEAKGWSCKDFADLEDKDLDRNEANTLINEIRICDPAVGSGHFLVSALNELIAIKSDLKVLQDETGKRLKGYTVSILNDELVVEDEESEPFSYGLQTTTNKPTAERQRVQKSLFHEKQTIIENCLFGVDINPNSVKICRLRLWIELLKNAYYTDESGFTELETLPNIDINIKQGNSLLSKFSLTEDLSDVFRKHKFSLRSYKDAVAAYKNAPNKDAKSGLQSFINDIKSQFRETVYNRDPRRAKLSKLRGERILLDSELSIFETVKDPKLIEFEKKRYNKLIGQVEAEIAEIESNTLYRGSFEWRFEFPEILNDKGNFVGFDAIIGNPPWGAELDAATLNRFRADYNEIGGSIIDTYTLFIYLSASICKKKTGITNFIVPDTFLRKTDRKPVRKFLLNKTLIDEIIETGPVFPEVRDTWCCIISYRNEQNDGSEILHKKISRFIVSVEERLKLFALGAWDKKGYMPQSIWREGNDLVIGYLANEVDQRIIKKIEANGNISLSDLFIVSRGEEGGKKSLVDNPEGNFFLVIPNDIEKNQCGEGIKVSDSTLTKGKIDLYSKPKIWITRIQKLRWKQRIVSCYDERINSSSLKTLQIIVSRKNDSQSIKALQAILSSRLINYYCVNYLADDLNSDYLKNIPLPKDFERFESDLSLKLDKLILTKTADQTSDTSAFEAEIDKLVYALYGLTDEEIAIVEG